MNRKNRSLAPIFIYGFAGNDGINAGGYDDLLDGGEDKWCLISPNPAKLAVRCGHISLMCLKAET